MRIHIFKAQGNLYGFTRDPSGANLPANRGAWSAFKAIEIFEDHPAPWDERSRHPHGNPKPRFLSDRSLDR